MKACKMVKLWGYLYPGCQRVLFCSKAVIMSGAAAIEILIEILLPLINKVD